MTDTYSFKPEKLLRRRIRYVATGAATENINDAQVRAGFLHVFTKISIENETNTFTQVRVGVWDGSIFHPYEEKKNPQAGTLYWTADPIYQAENDNLRIELKGCTLNDIVMVYIEEFYKKTTHKEKET